VLGTCYEKTNDRTSAYNAYAKQAQIKQDNEMGRYAVDRLNALKPYIEEQKKLKK
jgi:hypothetical protein